MDKYPYYAKLAESNPTWQNAIRHNLSTLPEFVMVGDKNQIIRDELYKNRSSRKSGSQ